MAVFLINICKFNGCGITFPSLGDLIQHIEDTHIDYDPQVIEQKEQSQPSCLPLSYVLRFITDAARKEGPFLGTSGAELKRKLAIKHHSYSMSSSNRSNTPTDIGSEMDEDEMMVSESEDSNDSWTTEEFSSEFIMRYGSRHSGSLGNNSSNEKPFACPVPGCKKRYKNVNGIKYHSKNGHKKDGKVRKGYKCHCGKSYKTSQGLKSHSLIAHNSTVVSTTNSTVAANNTTTNAAAIGTNIVAADQSFGLGSTSSTLSHSGSLSPSSVISNISGCSSQNQLSPNSNNSQSLSNTNQSNGNSMKTNFGLISIKSKSNLSATSSSSAQSTSPPASAGVSTSSTALSTSHKLVKLMTDTTGTDSKMSDGVGVKMSLPSLVNLGILTPATSPKQQQHQQQQQQQLHHQQQHHHQINNNNNNNTNNNNNEQQLPLTPISPNMSRNINFNNNNLNTSSTILNSGSVVDTITTDET